MYRILIAEDDDNLRHALEDYFCNKGFKVHDADNGDVPRLAADRKHDSYKHAVYSYSEGVRDDRRKDVA